MALSHLPDELLLVTLGCLDAASLVSACCVCRRWAALEKAAQATLWSRLVLETWPTANNGALNFMQLSSWKSRYRLLRFRGKPAEPKADPPTLAVPRGGGRRTIPGPMSSGSLPGCC